MKKGSGKAVEQAPAEDDIPGVLDVLVVGAGPAGLRAAREIMQSRPEASVLVLEAADRVGGRVLSGLHLLPATFAGNPAVKTGPLLTPAKIRWERAWVDPSAVNWADKDWAGGGKLPQWDLYFGREMVALLENAAPPEGLKVKLTAPVSKLACSSDTTVDGWQAETPTRSYFAQQVIWTAGIKAFQNAVGKIESLAYLIPNSIYEIAAADFRGGISLSLGFASKPIFEASFPESGVFGLPVRHGGKLYLMLGAWIPTVEGGGFLQTLTHVHQEIFVEPSEVLSFQKSLRRAVKSLLVEGESVEGAAKPSERWVVSDRVGGHVFGGKWLFGAGEAGVLEFAGDECASACSRNLQDTSGVLQPTTIT